ncbi:MAG: hypothetical protein IKH27_12140 [Oscillospiraceae bacterium]|nr:hypothetical protein [Oscillospiraceae bacterium]
MFCSTTSCVSGQKQTGFLLDLPAGSAKKIFLIYDIFILQTGFLTISVLKTPASPSKNASGQRGARAGVS